MRRRSARVLVIGLAAIVVAAGPSFAQTPRAADDTQSEQTFVEMLRREDAASAERYVALRDARAQALADLRKAETQYNNAGAELRAIFVRGLRDARRKYAQTSLALLDFFEARDRGLLERYQEEISRLKALVEERQKTRAELEKLLAP